MEVRITARNADTPDDVRKYADEKLGAFDKFSRHARSIEIVLGEDNLAKTVEIIAHLERGAPVVVNASHEDARAAIDIAHDKLEKVLRRHKERLEGRRRERGEAAGAPAAGASEEE